MPSSKKSKDMAMKPSKRLIEKFAEKIGTDMKTAEFIFQQHSELVLETLLQGKPFYFWNLGRLTSTKKAKYTLKMPGGVYNNVGGSKILSFKPTEVLKDIINKRAPKSSLNK